MIRAFVVLLVVVSCASGGWTPSDGQKLQFKHIDEAVAQSLSAEVIPLRGRWDNHGLRPCIYLLRSVVHSPSERQLRLLHNASTVPAVWLNGKPVGIRWTLRFGNNDLLIAYEPPVGQGFSPEHAGPMFRIGDPHSGRRLEDVRYQP